MRTWRNGQKHISSLDELLFFNSYLDQEMQHKRNRENYYYPDELDFLGETHVIMRICAEEERKRFRKAVMAVIGGLFGFSIMKYLLEYMTQEAASALAKKLKGEPAYMKAAERIAIHYHNETGSTPTSVRLRFVPDNDQYEIPPTIY